MIGHHYQHMFDRRGVYYLYCRSLTQLYMYCACLLSFPSLCMCKHACMLQCVWALPCHACALRDWTPSSLLFSMHTFFANPTHISCTSACSHYGAHMARESFNGDLRVWRPHIGFGPDASWHVKCSKPWTLISYAVRLESEAGMKVTALPQGSNTSRLRVSALGINLSLLRTI